MFEAWGRTAYRFRRLIAVLGIIFLVGTGVYGPLVFGALQSGGGFNVPNAQSTTADNLAASAIGRDTADLVVLYTMHGVPVSDPRFQTAVTRSLAALPAADVTAERTYWTTHSPAMVSTDGKSTYAVLSLAGATQKERQKVYDSIAGKLTPPGATVLVSGQVPTNEAINKQVTADISKAEGFSLPVLLILLLFIFGGLSAACLPLLIGGMGILGGFTVLHVISLFTDVAPYALNITTILGLGLAIDYGLFMVMRFRNELAIQQEGQTGPASREAVNKALTRTMATAGRTVAVSGLTVTVALCGMILFPETFLRSMGFGGVATVLVDMILALTVLPALLALLGHRVNSLSIRPALRRFGLARSVKHGQPRPGNGFWGAVGNIVTGKPAAIYAVVIVAGLLVLALPFRNVSWGGIDARDLPSSSSEARVAVALQNQFPANATTPITAILRLPGPVATQQAAIGGYEARLGAVSGVSSVQVTGASGEIVEVSAQFKYGTLSPQARALVTRVRGVPAPPGATVYVGGSTADLVDELANLGSVLPWMLLIMGLATFVLLFLAFGSLLVPIKAIAANLLTLLATFGIVTWIFQYGHLAGALGFTPTGTIEPSMPILMLAIIFGLSMDYEVFLVSRMREQYDLTGNPRQSIVEGLKRTGPIITSAALLLIIVIGSFSASGIVFIKLVGVGMFIAILLDATIVRAVLVPAVMALLGRAAWWAPGPLKHLYARYGVAERELPQPEPVAQRPR